MALIIIIIISSTGSRPVAWAPVNGRLGSGRVCWLSEHRRRAEACIQCGLCGMFRRDRVRHELHRWCRCCCCTGGGLQLFRRRVGSCSTKGPTYSWACLRSWVCNAACRREATDYRRTVQSGKLSTMSHSIPSRVNTRPCRKMPPPICISDSLLALCSAGACRPGTAHILLGGLRH